MTLARPVDELIAQLRSLGVGEDDIVMIHASMRRVGPVEGGAAGLIEALKAAVGPGGTLLMVLSADEDEPFHALRSPVDVEEMGILAEVFRTYPGVSVNDHPADRFAALGPRASYLLEPTPLHDYHGPGSVLERLTQSAGKVLRLGANADTVTLTHYAEYLADVPNKVRVRPPPLRSGGHRRAVDREPRPYGWHRNLGPRRLLPAALPRLPRFGRRFDRPGRPLRGRALRCSAVREVRRRVDEPAALRSVRPVRRAEQLLVVLRHKLGLGTHSVGATIAFLKRGGARARAPRWRPSR